MEAAVTSLEAHRQPPIGEVAQTSKVEPSVEILVACALILTSIAVVFVLLRLASVLVPLTFAVFLAFLAEPLLRIIVLSPQAVTELCANHCCGHSRRRSRGLSVETPLTSGGAGEGAAGSRRSGAGVFPAAMVEDDSMDDGPSAGADAESGVDIDEFAPHGRSCGDRCRKRLQLIWDVLSILICVVLLLGLGCAVVGGFYASLNSVHWKTYEQSPKLEDLEKLLARLGVNETSWEDVLRHYQGELANVATSLISILGDVVITMLLFFCCLFAIVPGIRSKMPRSRMRRLMQRYLLCKTLTSFIIACAVMLALWIMAVDLVFIFGMITFLFNFIPNIGSFFAIIAPAPLVYLTPDRTWNDVIIVLAVPFLIHNSLGCVLEPMLMKAGLDIHPLTVVVALTFWGCVWGVSGMILSVPITCGIRLLLEETNHPHARLLLNILDRPLGGHQRKRTSPVSTPDSSVSGRDLTD